VAEARYVVEDHDVEVAQNGGAFPDVEPAPNRNVVAHTAKEDLDVVQVSQFARGARVGRRDRFAQEAGAFQDVPAVRFVQADLFSRAEPVVPQAFRFQLSAVSRELLTVAFHAAPSRREQESLRLQDVPFGDKHAPAVMVGRECCQVLRARRLFDQVDLQERVPDGLGARLRLSAEIPRHRDWGCQPRQLF
jgi:hypothetical protein